MQVVKIITACGLAPANNEARRLIAQGGVSVDDVRVEDARQTLDASAGRSYLLKVGKRRFVRVTFA
jgi:tyrosyl-tRNA synthetase